MKRADSLRLKFIALAILIFTFTGLQPANAAQFLTTTSSTCYNYGMDSVYQLAQSFDIPSAATITSVQWKMYNTTAPVNAQIRFYSDSSGTPSSALGTLTYSSWSSPLGTFTGSVSLASAGRYWIRFSSTSRIDPCYYSSATTTGTPTGWALTNLYTKESSNSGSTFPDRADRIGFLFAMYGTGGGVAPTATSLSLSGNPSFTYRQSGNITFTLGVAGSDGKVTFYANGKKIAGCINKSSSALSVTCSWRPSLRGNVSLSAKLVPADPGFASSTSSSRSVLVSNRSGTR